MRQVKVLACARAHSYSSSFILGILLVFGFAPMNIWPLGIVVPAILLFLWRNPHGEKGATKKSLLNGFTFGLGLFGAGISWIYISIATYGNTNIFIALGVTISFVLILALFPAIQAYSYQHFSQYPMLNASLIFPSTWVLLELIRGTLFTGFPWLYLGYTLTFTPFSGFAKLFSVYGLSWLGIFLGACIYLYLRASTPKKLKIAAVCACIILFFLGYALKQHNFTEARGKPVSVILVQGNISQTEKWDPNALNKILLSYATLTGPHLNTALIVWPENAIPAFPEAVAPFLKSLDENTSLFKSAIVLGIPLEDPSGKDYYNGAIALGDAQGMYLKRHLVPFGEYLPMQARLGGLMQFLNIPMSNFSRGPEQQAPMRIHGLPVRLFICYESAYPFEVRSAVNQSAYVLTLTDDSWFGNSFAPYQQEEMEAMRAEEVERPFVRASNTGITSIINAQGSIVAKAPMFTATSLQGSIQPVIGMTPWQCCGPALLFALLILSYAGVLLYAYWVRRSRSSHNI